MKFNEFSHKFKERAQFVDFEQQAKVGGEGWEMDFHVYYLKVGEEMFVTTMNKNFIRCK